MRTIDVFCGCGGLSLGLEKAGLNVVAGFDHWDAALQVYRQNLKHDAIQIDINGDKAACKAVKVYKPDIIAGGPPCQDFSQAGGRAEGIRAALTIKFAGLIISIKPKYFIIENVDRAAESVAFRKAIEMLSHAGYGITEEILDASYCGVPQRRKRLFVVGALAAPDRFLSQSLLKNQSKSPMTVRRYLGKELDINHYYRHPRNYSRRGIFSLDEPAPTMRGVNRPVPPGYLGHTGDTARVSSNIRPLTAKERSRIQTFPKYFKWSGSKTETEQMIGNAVPVNLARFVGKALLDYVQSTDRRQKSNA